jgi:hypothetical protein
MQSLKLARPAHRPNDQLNGRLFCNPLRFQVQVRRWAQTVPQWKRRGLGPRLFVNGGSRYSVTLSMRFTPGKLALHR